MICPRFVARELTAPADGGGPGMVDQEVRHALCPGRRGANHESSTGIDASHQWTTDLARNSNSPLEVLAVKPKQRVRFRMANIGSTYEMRVRLDGHRMTVIAVDGSTEIRTPYDDCLLVMPSLRPGRGHTAVRLAKFVD